MTKKLSVLVLFAAVFLFSSSMSDIEREKLISSLPRASQDLALSKERTYGTKDAKGLDIIDKRSAPSPTTISPTPAPISTSPEDSEILQLLKVRVQTLGQLVQDLLRRIAQVNTPLIYPSEEICDGKDNDQDGLIDEGGVCEVERLRFDDRRLGSDDRRLDKLGQPQQPEFNGYIIQLQDKPVSKIYTEQLKNVEKGILTKQGLQQKVNSHRSLLIDKQNALETRIKSIIPKAKVESKVQNVFNGFAVFDISEQEAKQIESLPEAKRVSPNYKVYPTLMDSVPLINADDVWQLHDSQAKPITGEGITIGIIDTGVDYTHPDLGGCFGVGCKVAGGYDFIHYDEDPIDDHGHGTHVAAIAAGEGALNGVAPGATIYAYKVLDSGGSGSFDTVISAIERSADPNQDEDFSDQLDVISLSIGGYGNPDDSMSQAVDNAVNAGIVAVIAAGNAGPEGRNDCRHSEDPTGFSYSICSPGTARGAITVAASDKNDALAGFSSRGPTILETVKPDVSAPGVLICAAQWDSAWDYSKCFDNEHVAISGTSMATPHVSGVAALIKQAHPNWTPKQIKYVLRDTAIDLEGTILQDGWGRINALAAVQTPTMPLTPIIYPKASEIFRTAVIKGNIGTTDFIQYSLEYKSAFGSDSWTFLMSSTTLPADNILMDNWNTLLVPDGLYLIRLTVTDTNNRNWSDATPMNIRNSPALKILYGYTYPPSIKSYDIGAMPGETVYFKVVATAAGSSEGVCNSCSYQWYKNDVLASANPEYSTSFDGVSLDRHRVKVVITDPANGRTSEKTTLITIGLRPITTNPDSQWLPAIYGNKIVWQDYRNSNVGNEIYMYDLSTNTETRITTSTALQWYPAIYGNKIVWQDWRNGNWDIYMYDFSTSTETQITTSTAYQLFPAIYGNKIVWYDGKNGNDDIYMYDLPTNTETRITTSTANQDHPAIYGNKIVWHDGRNVSWDIYMYDLSTGNETQITTNLAHQLYPAIYGNKIVWQDYRNGNWDIYMYEPLTSTETQITTDSTDQWLPAIYGNKIVWHDYRNGNWDIYMLDLDIIPYLCGDLDASGVVDAVDVSYMIDYMFFGGAEPIPVESGDLDGNGVIDSVDLAILIDYVFFGAPTPTGCGKSSSVQKSIPTEEDKQFAQKKIDKAGLDIRVGESPSVIKRSVNGKTPVAK